MAGSPISSRHYSKHNDADQHTYNDEEDAEIGDHRHELIGKAYQEAGHPRNDDIDDKYMPGTSDELRMVHRIHLHGNVTYSEICMVSLP